MAGQNRANSLAFCLTLYFFLPRRNRSDACTIETASVLSPLEKIEIGHDNSGVAAGWYLDKVIVTCHETGCEQVILTTGFFLNTT